MPKGRKNGDDGSVDTAAADAAAAAMRNLYILADLKPPEGSGYGVPTLYWGLPADEMAAQIGDHLRGKNILFLREDEIGTIEPDTGRFRRMDADRFRTWLPRAGGMIPFSKFDDKTGKPVKVEIKVESARAVLSSDELRGRLPRVERINQIRMPVFRERLDERGDERRRGFGAMELLPVGYDAEARVYTVKSEVRIDEGMDPNEAVKFFRGLLKHFQMDDRSLAVQMASMLTVYGAGLFRGRPPMFVWNSNLPGSGKSRLAQLAIEAVFPGIGRSGFHWKDPGETRKEMDAVAQDFSPVLWFDDVTLPQGMELRSTDMNRWLTSRTWQCRVMGSKELWRGPLYAMTAVTGTHLELDDHLGRRSLFVDIFARQKARDRKLPGDAIMINDAFFDDAVMRGRILSGLWAIARHWDENWRQAALSKPLESFEGWSGVIPAAIASAGFGDAMAPFEAPDSGERRTREVKLLIAALVREYGEGKTGAFDVTMKQIVRTARLEGLFQDSLMSIEQVMSELNQRKGWEWRKVIDREQVYLPGTPEADMLEREPNEEDKRLQAAEWTDRSIDSKFGKEFKSAAVAGQWFTVGDRVWQFGDRRDYRGSRFEVSEVLDNRKGTGDPA